ncbi:MAG: putative glycoside hydrolase [Alkalibacterium thalassium]|nr:putative glycoside hydrolase [Alkalibacterium thalassium]
MKGIFVTAHSAGGSRLETLTELLNTTELNSMVIDVKDDYGDIVMPIESEHEYINQFTNNIVEAEPLMEHLEENDIYPIARIVVFKDSRLANERPDLSFTEDDGSVWANRRGESFVNPYEREVWEYNVEVARQAAKLGFKDIQFDYVRFPEGFEHRDEDLNYSRGDYEESDLDNVKQRVDAVTEFVAYARRELQPYDVDVSVDIFGYAATREETPGIGQNFSRISENVDVISSMIYPSHWGAGSLGIERPDLEPYNVIANYMELENEILDNLGDQAPISRPWIQDFTASYLGSGWYMNYGAEEVSEQVRALNEHGVNEFLLWNAGNRYSEGATYSFD